MGLRLIPRGRLGRLGLGVLAGLVIAASGLSIAFTLVPELEMPPPDLSVQVLDQQGRPLRLYTNGGGNWRLPVDSAQVDPRFIDELTAYEDKRFFQHPGVDPLALARAMVQWITHGEVISGASTITMQLVRLSHPRPRTLASKFIEIIQALRLERELSKKHILDRYLTLAPYGGNLQGLRAATRFYFDKEPLWLTPSERALLIALPQAPTKRRPDTYPQAAQAGRDQVLERLVGAGRISREDARLAASRPIPRVRLPAPLLAAHLADRLRNRQPQQTVIHTTIDGPLQRALERLASSAQQGLEEGVTLAALVVDHQRSEVKGYLGSGGFLATMQLDLVNAVRSPGSALKPFIYGMGFERNLIHPETRLLDQPRWVGAYGPQNFDSRYSGEVSIREALLRSLNTPAVRLLEAVGPQGFHHRLARAEVELRLPEQALPGLPTALGGVGMTLEDLTRLYAALAKGGQASSLRYTRDSQARPLGQLLSPMAAWYLDDILSASEPPPGHIKGRAIRFKTGTSYGFRDAWAIGYAGRYSVGVWLGRPDGGYNPGVTGLTGAAPLLFRIFDLLPVSPHQPAPPAGVLQLTHAELPATLKWFGDEGVGDGDRSRPRIRFPLDGSSTRLSEVAQASGLAGLPLMVEGGQPPYHWLVDGRPLRGGVLRRTTQWQPQGPGHSRITVIDGIGATDRVEVWID